ncbi:hypothetical protein KAX02_13740 [candidate division WOR-3 bacterium]|nr:hypothetical protein [candidate division WOR-3 bacterium]
MAEDVRTEDGTTEGNKALIEEIADLDFTGDDKPLEASTEEDSKTVDEGEEKDETVGDDKKSVDESEEGLDDEKNKEEDTKTSEEEEDKKTLAEDKGEKPDESKEEKDVKEEVSQVDKLLAEINRLSGPIESDIESKSEEKEDEEEKPPEKGEVKPAEDSIYDFVKDIDMDDVASDSAVLNKILHAVEIRVRQQTAEQILRSLPQVVTSQVQQQTYFKKMADTFYEDNKDLVNVKQVVKACAQQLRKNNPEWEIEKIFTEAAIKTRETLGMSVQKVTVDEDITSAEDAAFAKSKGGSKSNLKQRKSSLQAEIDEL